MSAYLKTSSRPVLFPADSSALRAEPPTQLVAGQLALFTGAGGNFRKLASYDTTSTASDDGSSVWKPSAILTSAPGRWLVVGGENEGPHTYVKRKADGTIDGAGGATPDFADPVLHVNVGGAVPSTGLYGLSVDFTVGANRRGLFWDAANATFAAAQDTLGDDATISSYLPLRVAALKIDSIENSSGGTASSGLVRMASGDEIRARIGSQYRLAAALAGPVLAFGDSAAATTTIDAAGTIRMTVASGTLDFRAGELTFKDALGSSTLLDISASGQTFKVYSRLTAYNGGTAVLDVDVGSTATSLNGRVDINDGTGVSNYFHVAAGSTEARGDFIAKNLAASANILKVTGASALVQVNGELLVKDSTGTTTLLDATPGTTTVAVTGTLTASVGLTVPAIDRASNGALSLGSHVTSMAFGVTGGAALTGVLSLDNASAAMTYGASATSLAFGNGTITSTYTGLADFIYAGIGNTATSARKLRNTTASSVGTTVQRAPQDLWEAHARVSGADRTFLAAVEVVPTTGGNLSIQWKYCIDGTGTLSNAFRYVTSTSGQFAFALECSAFSCTGSSGYFFDNDNSGLSRISGNVGLKIYNGDGTQPLTVSTESALNLQTGGANTRMRFESTGNATLFAGTGSYGSGVLVLFVHDATTEPTTNPSGGGIFYSFGGALKWRGSAGTVTTIAPA